MEKEPIDSSETTNDSDSEEDFSREQASGRFQAYFTGTLAVLFALAVFAGLVMTLSEAIPHNRRTSVRVGPISVTPVNPEKAVTWDGTVTMSLHSETLFSLLDARGMSVILNTRGIFLSLTKNRPDGRGAYGTGFMIAPDLLVTAAHVIAPGYDGPIIVSCPVENEIGENTTGGEVVALDRGIDTAIIRVHGCPCVDGMPTKLAETEPDADDYLHGLGYVPSYSYERGTLMFEGTHRHTSAMPSANMFPNGCPTVCGDGPEDAECRRAYDGDWCADLRERARTVSGLFQVGNSGGPIFGSDGLVIGMIVVTDVLRGRTYIVPSRTIKEFAEENGIDL